MGGDWKMLTIKDDIKQGDIVLKLVKLLLIKLVRNTDNIIKKLTNALN